MSLRNIERTAISLKSTLDNFDSFKAYLLDTLIEIFLKINYF